MKRIVRPYANGENLISLYQQNMLNPMILFVDILVLKLLHSPGPSIFQSVVSLTSSLEVKM